ncbi:SDR family NAD(P)-dependent oxidoreductase [Hamadaea tsunoensis]|uniref:SDR family NAD(P)-dependent oxidoreductase n=1 Tax=Hamadaea tsunoensis TaxID=53368 RepID=UPI0004275621|nr:SDR family NAD(P)-dependent oxidoreductase [Hamadaea tsunoensis]
MNATVLITGASSGIGLATAVAAARAGFTTVGTVRRPDGDLALREAAEKAGVWIDVVTLEVTDPESVHDCVRSVVAMHGRLDALVNNAGVAGIAPTAELCAMQSLRASMEVNFFGVVAMTRAAMPHLRAARGRLVTVSSVRGVVGQPFNEAYSAAKFAVEGFMEGLAPVAAEVGVRVSVVEPAAVLDTDFIANAHADPTAMLAAAGPYEEAYRAYRGWVQTGAVEGAQVAADVADVVVATLTADQPAFRVQTSEYARRYVSRKLADPDGSVIQALTRSWVRPDPAP